jgi:hypothetical protein
MSWKRFKFGNQKIYVVPGSDHRFRTEHDARFYCEQNGIDFATVEKYDSKKEYDRWLELQILQRAGEVSDLRRQVEFELIPARYETVFVKHKTVKQWLVFTDPGSGTSFDTKKAAIEFCKSKGLRLKDIGYITKEEPVYKEVCIEQNAVYTADFVYKDKDGNEIVEDTKSEVTRKEADYVLRRKLMLHVHGIRIKET